jgi:hypothetical protein
MQMQKTATKKLTKAVKQDIRWFVENNQPTLDWNRAEFDRKTMAHIMEHGLDDWLTDAYDNNIDLIFKLEKDLAREAQQKWSEYDPDAVMEHVFEYVSVDMDEKHLLSCLPDVTMVAYMHSNYDCCNSFDELEPEGYLGEVFERVKAGVTQEDYLFEFRNGAYGGSLFCFAFKMDIVKALALLEGIKSAEAVEIPKGTQFGFFSSFSGSGSVFEKTTVQDMTIPMLGETEYDTVFLTADACQHYSLIDVYGDDSFINYNEITLKMAS